MIDHFENLWERAENLSDSFYNKKEWNESDVISELQENFLFLKIAIKNKDTVGHSNLIGEILFNITFLSKKLNINTHSALKEHVEDIKIEMLDPDIDNKTV